MIKIPKPLLEKLIEELKKAQEDFFIPGTEDLIREAKYYIDKKL